MDWLFGRRRRRAEAGVGIATRPGESKERAETGQEEEYIFGESEAEISRLDFQHYMFRLAFKGDFSAPIPAPRDILDVACGTGRLARELARRFPEANVVGFDINREQIEASLAEGRDIVPENCTFVYGDALQPFQFYSGAFDFVLARACSAFIPVAQWPLVVGQMARVTRPGGWVELRDFGLVRSKNAALNELTVKFANLAQARGIHPGAGPFLKQYLVAAQLRDVQVTRLTVNSAARRGTRAGQLMLIDYLAVLERITPAVAQSGTDTAQHWQALIGQVRAATRTMPDDQYAEVELTAAYGRR
jgi:ubiquinone/menaquinone biosynthesis C-methylase UbiE